MAEEFEQLRLPIVTDLDEASAARAGEQMASIVGNRFAAGISGKASKAIRDDLANVGKGPTSAALSRVFDPLNRSAQSAQRSVRNLSGSFTSIRQAAQAAQQSLGGIGQAAQTAQHSFTSIGQAAQAAQRSVGGIGRSAHTAQQTLGGVGTAGVAAFSTVNRRLQEADKDLRAINEAADAFRATLAKTSADPRLFSGFNRAIEKANEALRELDDAVRRGAAPGEIKRLEGVLDASVKLAQKQIPAFQSTLKTLTSAEAKAAEQIRVSGQQAATRRQRESDQAHGKYIAAYQREGAQILTETRIAGQKQIQESRIAARTRIELARFAFAQIKQLERGIAGVFRATGTIATSAFRALGTAIERIGGLFRRSNRDLNDGLNAALTRRERSINDSFSRQERATRATVNKQSRLIQQLQTRQSKGFAGILSGRSQLATSLGVGGILGGGLLGGNLLSGGLQRFTSLERINIQLERLTGSAQATKDVLADLVELARQTPLELTDVSNAAVGLLSAGTGIKQLVPFVESLADAIGFTGGGAEQLQRVALAIRQIASIGRLQGEEIRQLAESLPGLNIPQLLADQITKGDTGLLLKMSEAGEISATEFTKAFSAALQSDPRIAGAATATVNTLGGQIAILKETFDTLGAAVIGALRPFLLFSIQGTTRRLEFLTRLITDDTNPQLVLLRKGLIGVAAGLAALAAAKAAGEAFQFLALGIRSVLTPLGLLITAFALIGGTVAVLRQINPVFKDMTDRLAAFAQGVAESGLSRLGGLLVAVGDAIANNAMPALNALAGIIERVIAPALGIIGGLIVGIVLPALIRLANFVSANFVPALDAIAGVVTGTVVPALLTLGDAFARAFSGDFSGFADIGGNIGQALSGVASVVAGALGPIASAVRDRLASIFDGVDPGRILAGALKFVNLVGRILGQVITNRTFLQVIEKVAFVAAAIAASFLLGFASAVVKGLPGAVDAILDGLADALGQAGVPSIITGLLRNSITGIATLVGAGLLVATVIRAFTQLGNRAAGAFSGGFIPGLKRSVGGSFAFLHGLRDPDHAMGNFGRRQAVAFQKEFDRVMRNNSRLGISSDVVTSGQLKRDETDPFKQKEGLRRLLAEQNRAIVNDAAAAGVLYRRTWANIITGTGNDITSRWQAIQDRVAQTGGWGRVGQVAATTLVTSFGAFLSGKQGGTGGLIGVIASTLGAAAVGGPLAAAITGIVGAAGLLTSAFSNNGDAAEIARGQVAGYVEILKQFKSIAEATPDLAERITDTLLDQGTAVQAVLQRSGFNTRDFVTQVTSGQGSLASIIRDLTDGLNVDERRINAFAASEIALGHSTQQALDDLDKAARGKTSTIQAQALAGEIRSANVDAEAFTQTLQVLFDQAGFILTGVGDNTLRDQLLETSTAAKRAVTDLNTLDRTRKNLEGKPVDDSVLGRLTRIRDTESAFAQAKDLMKDFKFSAQETFDLVVDLAKQLQIDIDLDWLHELIGGFDTASVGANRAAEATRLYNQALGALNSREDDLAAGRRQRERERATAISEQLQDNELVSKAIDQLNKQRTEGIQSQVDSLTNRLDVVTKAAQEAKEALTDFITAQFVDSPQALVDDLIGSIDGIGSAIEAAMLQGGVQGEAAVRSALGDLDSQIAAIVQAGVEAGMSGQQITDLLNQAFGAINEQVGGSGARISTLDFTDGITPAAGQKIIDELSRVLDPHKIDVNTSAFFEAQNEVDRIQGELDRLQATLQVQVEFDSAQVAGALAAAGVPLAIAQALVTPEALTAAQQGTDLDATVKTLLAALGAVFGNAPGQPFTPAQITEINTTIVGVPDADQTASAAVGAMSAAAGGTTVRQPVSRNNLVIVPSRGPSRVS